VIATGEADERDGDYFGPVLNEAAMMLESCEPARILASAVTRAVVGNALPEGWEWRLLETKTPKATRSDLAPLFELIRRNP
jgi:class 3 adenylate cyclase